jgi:hypothetical protein
MQRFAQLVTVCLLSLPVAASAQEFPSPANRIYPEPRVAQAAPVVKPAPVVQPTAPLPTPIRATSLSEITPTPEMWFYEQKRQERSDPRNAVRANAEFRAEQRRERLAAMQWFGYSAARPTHAVTPYTSSTPSPQWSSNTFDPFRWSTRREAVVHLPAWRSWR